MYNLNSLDLDILYKSHCRTLAQLFSLRQHGTLFIYVYWFCALQGAEPIHGNELRLRFARCILSATTIRDVVILSRSEGSLGAWE